MTLPFFYQASCVNQHPTGMNWYGDLRGNVFEARADADKHDKLNAGHTAFVNENVQVFRAVCRRTDHLFGGIWTSLWTNYQMKAQKEAEMHSNFFLYKDHNAQVEQN